jgi:hypothetical protein
VPGLLGDRGVLEYAEDVWLDYTHPDNPITVRRSACPLLLSPTCVDGTHFCSFSPQFTLATMSNVRVYVEEHHVDIDIRLSNASGKHASLLCVGSLRHLLPCFTI